ncbi:Manganese/iron superoxide dismutase [Peziza echinospora]|nr:Manganese/iron superoxide dismutase [Peziza echinospora]
MIGRTAATLLRRQCAASCTAVFRSTASPLLKRQATGIISSVRSLHSVPDFDNLEKWRNEGMKPLFSPDGIEAAWTTYQGSLVDKLNELVAETVIENETAFDTSLMASRRPELAAVFNYASQAHNNHFFFESLTSAEIANSKDIPSNVVEAINDTFGSLDAMRNELLATAQAIFGSGWVWLVMDQTRNLRILATYNAGSPYPGAQARQQGVDTNLYSNRAQAFPGDVLEQTRLASSSRRGITPFPMPLLALSVWPQTWMTDFGVNGKEQYLSAWWECVDWDVVERRLPHKKERRTMLFTR